MKLRGLGSLDGFDDVVDDGRVLVVERLAGAERADELVVVLGGDGDHVDARGDGELDGEGADGRAGAVDDESLAGLSRGQGRVLEAHEALLAGAVEARGGGVDGQGQDDGLAVAGAFGDLGGDGSRSRRVELESTVLGVLGCNAGGVAEDAVALGEVLHVRTDFGDLAGDVAADDDGPLLDEEAGVLDLPVDGVDGDGVVLDDDLVGAGLGHLGAVDAELLVLAIEVGCLVGHGGGCCEVLICWCWFCFASDCLV